jgi:hypothetical protein
MFTAPLQPEIYQPCLKEEFVLRGGDGSVQVVTLEAVDVTIRNDDQLAFSLLFRPPADAAPLASASHGGICRLSHPRLGEFDLFLVPIKQRRGVTLYEAVFNLLKDEAQ